MKSIHVLLVIAIFITSLGIANHESQIKELQDQISKLKKERKTTINKQYLLIGKKDEPIQFECEVTAYTNGFESTGKTPSHPAYGLTKSGTKTVENRTVAVSSFKQFPKGTKLKIEGFDNLFVVEDKMKSNEENKVDIFFENLHDALSFGKKKLNITVVE